MNAEAINKPLELIFGEQCFQVQPLTIGQVEQLEAMFLGEVKLSPLQQAHEAVRIALGDAHAATDVAKLRIGARDLAAMLPRIIAFAGFREAQPGEASAAA